MVTLAIHNIFNKTQNTQVNSPIVLHYLTEWRIEANPDKCREFFELLTPTSKKFIQFLNGMLTLLSRFMAKSAQHAIPFFKLLHKEVAFEWTEECEQVVLHLKRAL